MAYAVYFLFSGMASTLPWEHCDHKFNTDHCYDVTKALECNVTLEETLYHDNCTYAGEFCAENGLGYDDGMGFNADGELVFGFCVGSGIEGEGIPIPFQEIYYRTSPSEEFWSVSQFSSFF